MAAPRMNDNFDQHTPVLLNEAVANLITNKDGVYVDATFGRGSHSQAILNSLGAQGRLIAFDKDLAAIAYGKTHFNDPRFHLYHHSYSNLEIVLRELDLLGKVNGILFDLGVSSPQLDNPARGFSFSQEGPLDMRMDTTAGLSAAEWLAQVEEQALTEVLWKYGDEKFARRIARAIVTAREENPITTTSALAKIISQAVPKTKDYFEKHPATRSFQAIRIEINQELTELTTGLQQALTSLIPGGRLAVISFHSLEDRIVKHFIKDNEKGKALPRGLPIKGNQFNAKLKSIGKPIKPSVKEINLNPRSRSAILRIAEKTS